MRLEFDYRVCMWERKTSGAILSFLCNQKMIDKIMHRKIKIKVKKKTSFCKIIIKQWISIIGNMVVKINCDTKIRNV